MEFLNRISWEMIVIGILLCIVLFGAHSMSNPWTRNAKRQEKDDSPTNTTKTYPFKGSGGKRKFRRTGPGSKREY